MVDPEVFPAWMTPADLDNAVHGDLVSYVERVSGISSPELAQFFSHGMLMNVLSSMDAPAEDWGRRLVEGCKADQ